MRKKRGANELGKELFIAASRPVLPLLPGEEEDPNDPIERDPACDQARRAALSAYVLKAKEGGEVLSKAAHHVLNCDACKKYKHLSKFLKKFL